MLPFTKRPGRNDDSEAVSKDDPSVSSTSVPPTSSVKRSAPPEASRSPRGPLHSAPEEEMTNIMQSRSFTGPVIAGVGVLPAAGRPASVPPGRVSTLRPPPASIRPPPASIRPPPVTTASDDDDDADDEEEGRTVVRGAKRRAKKNLGQQTAPSSISPAAVIKATLESARANRRDLLPAPPTDLLEDRSDFADKSQSQRAPYSARSHAPQGMSGYGSHGSGFEGPPSLRPPPMGLEGPPSYPPGSNYGSVAPPSSARNNHNAGYSGGYAPLPGISPAMPAHFRTPQAPQSDPPGMAVTSANRVAGRPAISWAAALLACGLFVGVAAVAVMQSSDSVADTTASFVDPARAPVKNAPAAAQPTPVPVNAQGAPAAPGDPNAANHPSNAAPGANGLIGASPVPAPAQPPPAEPAVAPVVTTPAPPAVAAAPPAAAPAAAKKPVFSWKPAAPAAAPPRAPAKVAVEKSPDDEPKKGAAGKKKGGETDDETKKALEALQKAQLESASSFGKE
jgi:hypothetical protein